MGLLFQPRWTGDRRHHPAPSDEDGLSVDRAAVFLTALEAVVLGDGSRFPGVFTDDVVFSSPHLMVETLPVLLHEVGSPEDSLSDVSIVVLGLDAFGDKVIAEWRLQARFTRPVLFDDRVLIEPTGGSVCLPGASVAEFRDQRIRAFRHYFDDSELLSGVPGTPSHLRWTSDP